MKRLLIIFAALLFAFGCVHMGAAGNKGTFAFLGADALSANTSMDVLTTARYAVVKKFQHWVKDAQGKDYDPTFSESSRSWDSDNSHGKPATRLSRGKTVFKDADGHLIVIETIHAVGQPALVFFAHDGMPSAEAICNAFAASLQEQGVEMMDAN